MNKATNSAFINQMLVYSLVMICFSGSVGIGAVWLRQQIAQTANSIRQLEASTRETDRRLSEIDTLIAAEHSAEVLERRNVEWNLGLVQPREQQVVRVTESVEQRLAAKRNSELFTPAVSPVPMPGRFVIGGVQ